MLHLLLLKFTRRNH